MIKAILFDFDGVLTIDKTGSQSIISYIVLRTNMSLEIFKNAYYKYNDGLLAGEYTHKDIWQQLCIDIGMQIDYKLLIESFKNTLLDNEMIDFVKEIHEGYKTALVTDNKEDRIEVIGRVNNFEKLFDTISVSAYFKSGKDKSLIFEKTLESLGVLAEECIFVDNTEENLVIPRKMGVKTILYDYENRDINVFKDKFNKVIERERDNYGHR